MLQLLITESYLESFVGEKYEETGEWNDLLKLINEPDYSELV